MEQTDQMEQLTSPASADTLPEPKDSSDIKQQSQLKQRCDRSRQARLLEETARKALALKKKELKWKLMRASQSRNRDKLREIQTSLNYHKQKLTKAKLLAAKLREKYVKVIKLAKLTELHCKKTETQLSQQERFVADEKMQLTKLSLECIKIGAELFGDKYKLPENSSNQKDSKAHPPPVPAVKSRPILKPKPKTKLRPTPPVKEADRRVNSKDEASSRSLLEKLSPFLRKARIAEPMGYLILDGVQDIASRKAQVVNDSKNTGQS